MYQNQCDEPRPVLLLICSTAVGEHVNQTKIEVHTCNGNYRYSCETCGRYYVDITVYNIYITHCLCVI